ncbi:MAG: YaaL family protein [Clostridia bacterium]|nr:YaaL family protein [Clostridia bacterium]
MYAGSYKSENIRLEKPKRETWFSKLIPVKGNTSVTAVDDSEEIRQLLEYINVTRTEWSAAVKNFEFAESEEIVDYYTYKIKAYEVMYEYLIKQAKEKGIRFV